MGEPLEIAKVLVEPSIKLLELVGNAIGTIYAPVHERKMADAEAYKIKTISEAINEASLLPLTYEKDGLSINAVDANDLYRRAELREIQQKIREQKNIEGVIGYAQQELLAAPKVPNTPVDDDWMNRLLNNAKEVSSSTMQFIWGRILAGEVVKPGSFSKRTLETIRNISQEEAEIFQNALPLVINCGRNKKMIPGSGKLRTRYGNPTEKLVLLSECGLIGSENGNLFHLELEGTDGAAMRSKNRIMFFSCSDDTKTSVTCGGFALTRAGLELERILMYDTNDEFFVELAKEYFDLGNQKVNIAVHKINYETESQLNYDDEPLVVFSSN